MGDWRAVRFRRTAVQKWTAVHPRHVSGYRVGAESGCRLQVTETDTRLARLSISANEAGCGAIGYRDRTIRSIPIPMRKTPTRAKSSRPDHVDLFCLYAVGELTFTAKNSFPNIPPRIATQPKTIRRTPIQGLVTHCEKFAKKIVVSESDHRVGADYFFVEVVRELGGALLGFEVDVGYAEALRET